MFDCCGVSSHTVHVPSDVDSVSVVTSPGGKSRSPKKDKETESLSLALALSLSLSLWCMFAGGVKNLAFSIIPLLLQS